MVIRGGNGRERGRQRRTADALALVLSSSLFRSHCCGINTTLDIRKYARASSRALSLSLSHARHFNKLSCNNNKSKAGEHCERSFFLHSLLFLFLLGGCFCTLTYGNGAYQLFFVLNSALCNLNGYGSPACE